MARHRADEKTCNRCGRSGSHAFRRTPDGLYECTTTTACRARARRSVGGRTDGRGRVPRQGGLAGSGPGVAYVIGEECEERTRVVETLREVTDLAIAVGLPQRSTLVALGSRNVKLLVIAAEVLDSVGIRNELGLRLRQPRLGAVPIFVYGRTSALKPVSGRIKATATVTYQRPEEVARDLRRQLLAFEGRRASGDVAAH